MARIRSVALATALAVAATASLASVVEASPAGPTSGVQGTAPEAAAGPAARAMTPAPVSVHPLDPSVVAAHAGSPAGAPQSVTQVIQVAVIGGPIELATEAASVVLERVAGSKTDWVGTLPPVRVVDARGTHEGWAVRWAVAGVEVDGTEPNHLPAAKVRVEPGAPAVVAGLPDGLTAGKPAPGVPEGRVLFSAAPDSGGGTYEAGGTVSLRLPSSVDASTVTVHLAFTLG